MTIKNLTAISALLISTFCAGSARADFAYATQMASAVCKPQYFTTSHTHSVYTFRYDGKMYTKDRYQAGYEIYNEKILPTTGARSRFLCQLPMNAVTLTPHNLSRVIVVVCWTKTKPLAASTSDTERISFAAAPAPTAASETQPVDHPRHVSLSPLERRSRVAIF